MPAPLRIPARVFTDYSKAVTDYNMRQGVRLFEIETRAGIVFVVAHTLYQAQCAAGNWSLLGHKEYGGRAIAERMQTS